MGYQLTRRNHDRKVSAETNNRRLTTIISHVNSNESNILKTSQIDDFKRASNCPYPNLQNFSSSNKIITLPKIINTESSVCINYKIAVSNDIN